jgi:hypothetical protein
MKPLPPHLEGMTQARWDSLSRAERDQLRDTSDLHPRLVPFIGRKVRVTPKRASGRSTFRVGITTGWRPALLAMRAGACGSSDLIRANETFTSVIEVTA